MQRVPERPEPKDALQRLLSQPRSRSGQSPLESSWAWQKGVPQGASFCAQPLSAVGGSGWWRGSSCGRKVVCCTIPIQVRHALPQAARQHGQAPCPTPQPSLCLEVRPSRCPGNCWHPCHWQRSCIPWEVGGAPCSMGPSPRGARSHSPAPCPGRGVPPVGKRGGR